MKVHQRTKSRESWALTQGIEAVICFAFNKHQGYKQAEAGLQAQNR